MSSSLKSRRVSSLKSKDCCYYWVLKTIPSELKSLLFPWFSTAHMPHNPTQLSALHSLRKTVTCGWKLQTILVGQPYIYTASLFTFSWFIQTSADFTTFQYDVLQCMITLWIISVDNDNEGCVWSKCLYWHTYHQLSFLTSCWDFYRRCAIEWKWKAAQHSPVACLATETAKVVSRSNDYRKLIDLITFCEAHNHLASVASICAHSHHEGPQAFSYE